MKTVTIVHLLTLVQVLAWPSWPLPPDRGPTLPGKFVPFPKLTTCPKLALRPEPTGAMDVRPDDIRVVMAIGDSITAGFIAKQSRQTGKKGSELHDGEAQQHWIPVVKPELREYRGLSYPIGGDEDAVTLPNILLHYSPELKGMSRGSHLPVTVLRPEKDGLNAAVGGSLSANLLGQVEDYLLPAIKAMDIDRKAWKFLNVGIGANDLCAFCLAPNSTALDIVGAPADFASGIKDAVELLRKHVPRLIVNIVGTFSVSSIYALTLKEPYCRGPFIPPVFPHLSLECSCAFLPGPTGDYTRQKMDELGEAYDLAVLEMIRKWEEEGDPSFGALWQPGRFVDLENWPPEALSPIDCFHPSEAGHQRVAAGLWNRLTLENELKATPISWEEKVHVRCLEERDRFPIGMATRHLERLKVQHV